MILDIENNDGELIISYYDKEAGEFPKGETKV